MTREQAINYLISSGFTHEQVGEVVRALTYSPTTKNDLEVDCISRADAIQAMQDKAKKLTNEDTINGLCGAVAILYEMPSVTPQLSVPEVTALAEWTEKLTKASEDAYNKGYADGMKAQEPRKGHWIGHREHCENLGIMMPNSIDVYEWCSNCDCGIDVREWHRNNYNYCPNCGADMREVEE